MPSQRNLKAGAVAMPMAILRLIVLLAPAALLVGASFRVDEDAARWLGLGVAVQLMAAGVLMAFYRTWAPPVGPVVLVCYVIALCSFWASIPRGLQDWYLHLVQALLVVAPLGIVAGYTLQQSGALLVQRARKLAKQIAERSNWPSDLQACKDLPEVKAFREAISFDATPALQLLDAKRPEVRLSALAALEFRKHWRVGQAETVLALLRREVIPEVRAAAVLALANIEDRMLVEVVAEHLRDADPRVRRATCDALFWSTERRWSWIRFAVRKALNDPQLRHEGTLIHEGQKLSPEAVNDLTAWAAEKGLIGLRSSQILGIHYACVLHEQPDATLPELARIVQDPHAAPLLRIELAKLLVGNQVMEHEMKEQLLDPANPAPLRLLVSENLLDGGPHVRAIVCLREIARLPNRELALATASVVQRCLGVDLGLALGQPLPPLNSPRAIDVTRRLMAWAAQPDVSDNVLESPFGTTFSRLSMH